MTAKDLATSGASRIRSIMFLSLMLAEMLSSLIALAAVGEGALEGTVLEHLGSQVDFELVRELNGV
jgi:hypothetical protein